MMSARQLGQFASRITRSSAIRGPRLPADNMPTESRIVPVYPAFCRMK
jgi:hypothetical protein